MPSAFSWLMLVPSSLRLPAPVNQALGPVFPHFYRESKDMKLSATLGLTAMLSAISFHACGQQAIADGNRAFLAGDCATAVRLLDPAAKHASPEAQKIVGDMYALGRCKPRDAQKSYELYLKAAEAGLPLAQYNIAVALDRGDGIQPNLAQAVMWYQRAANAGNAEAQSNLAVLYLTGRGVERNEFRGFQLTEAAAAQGYAPAQDNLARIYREGIGRTQNLQTAFEWQVKSAQKGHPQALLNLGATYEYGVGVQQSAALAYIMYRLADKMGVTKAKEGLTRLSIKLSEPQISKAERIISRWRVGMPLPNTMPTQ